MQVSYGDYLAFNTACIGQKRKQHQPQHGLSGFATEV